MRRILSTIFLLLALFYLFGCPRSPSPSFFAGKDCSSDRFEHTIPIRVDQNFFGWEKFEIQSAVAEWNLALNGNIKLKIVSENFDMDPDQIIETISRSGWLFLKINEDSYLIPSPSTLAFTNDLSGYYLYAIDGRYSESSFRGIIRHEIGHLLGAEHDVDGLMFPGYDFVKFECIDQRTILQISIRHQINPPCLSYCFHPED